MGKRAISVSLAKIDYNHGKPHMYVLADCPQGYYFTKFFITVHMLKNGEWIEKEYDASNTIFKDRDVNDLVLNLPIEALEGVSGPAIYHVNISAENSEYKKISDHLYLSDVQYIYRYLLDDVLSADSCNKVSDEAIKKYLTLYAHQKALADGDLDVAKYLFRLMHNSFAKCNNKYTRTVNCKCND